MVEARLNSVWSEGKDASDPLIIKNICMSCGLDGEFLVHAALHDTKLKDKLRTQTGKCDIKYTTKFVE